MALGARELREAALTLVLKCRLGGPPVARCQARKARKFYTHPLTHSPAFPATGREKSYSRDRLEDDLKDDL